MPDEDTDEQAFRAGVAAWIAGNFPASLQGRSDLAFIFDDKPPREDLARWRASIVGQGWGAPTWPVEYGGAALTARQARIVHQELLRAGAFNPMGEVLGLNMVGPAILDFGDAGQKQRHLPGIARGDVRWCLGYSEPGAGSDLVSLSTRCEDRGDHWLVNGQKIWTSRATSSDWCGALVRTDPAARRYDGISFVLFDMHQPGVDARRIPLISGAADFCEMFLTDVRVEKGNMLGSPGQGWSIGKKLLDYERSSQTGEGVVNQKKPEALADIARRYAEFDDAGRLTDTDLRARLARHLMAAKAHELTLDRVAAGGSGVPGVVSMLKNSATDVAQARSELIIELMGNRGLGWEGEGFAGDELEAVRSWLGGKPMSIYGGTAEVQNNLIAKRILGLPDTPRAG